VEGLDVDPIAYATSGEVEMHAFTPEFLSIEWADKADINIIEIDKIEDRHLRAMVSLPVVLGLRFSVELS
jgi:hypothetical protein